jgi:hypothetical protein
MMPSGCLASASPKSPCTLQHIHVTSGRLELRLELMFSLTLRITALDSCLRFTYAILLAVLMVEPLPQLS